MIQFGTGGWRAIIGDEFTKANVQLLTAGIARKLKQDKNDMRDFLIGYDRRFLSEEAVKWAAEIMAAEGIPCRVINRESPTPLIMFTVQRHNSALGMAITASHNPAVYNGIKVFMQGGRDADEDLTRELEEHIAAIDPGGVRGIPFEEAIAAGKVELIDPMNEYIDSILATIDMEAVRRRGLRVVLDPMFGVSKKALQTILLTTRCDVDVIHELRDPMFGGRLPAPNADTLADLMIYLDEHHCDVGLATDGDADRLGVVNNEAEFLHPNKVLALLYYYLLKYKHWHGAAVRNIATTHLLDHIAETFSETCYEVPVGFKHISSKMLETGAIIGGESSGGLTGRGHIQGKDGIYAAALIVEMLAVTGRSLSDLWREIEDAYGTFDMSERDYRFSQAKKDEIYRTLFTDKLVPDFGLEIDRVSYLDGCKVYFKNGGWIIARFSGTEPLLRIFCEMDNMKSAQKTTRVLEKFLQL